MSPEAAALTWCPFASVPTNVTTGPSSGNRGGEVDGKSNCWGPRCQMWEWESGTMDGDLGYCAAKIERTR